MKHSFKTDLALFAAAFIAAASVLGADTSLADIAHMLIADGGIADMVDSLVKVG